MQRIRIEPDFDFWRSAARDALQQGLAPGEINFHDATEPEPLTLAFASAAARGGSQIASPHVPKKFLDTARIVAVHRDPQRWNLLYRVLWRLQSEPELMRVEVDDDVAQLYRMEGAVRRDLHKMHAFVRFRKVDETGASGGLTEHYIAWYRPDHRNVRLAAPFFQERFAVMRWTVLTPDECVSWDPLLQRLSFGPGVSREAAPAADELETLWRSYYGSIFNPARVNSEAMRSEMPVRYWSHLPEVALLPELLQRAETRVATMVTRQQQQPTAAPFVPEEHQLPVLRAAMPRCEGCELYKAKAATQAVPGAGAARAALMLVGEQPGDQEDLKGEPFVGPAGGVLRKALAELRIEPKDVYMTNAVKHFKYVQRGKLRLHQSPRMSEINACRPWLLAEIDAVRPHTVLCLGATAAKSLLGGTFALMREHGMVKQTPYAERVIATVHPSAVLRARDEPGRAQLYRFLVDDLALAYSSAMSVAAR